MPVTMVTRRRSEVRRLSPSRRTSSQPGARPCARPACSSTRPCSPERSTAAHAGAAGAAVEDHGQLGAVVEGRAEEAAQLLVADVGGAAGGVGGDQALIVAVGLGRAGVAHLRAVAGVVEEARVTGAGALDE